MSAPFRTRRQDAALVAVFRGQAHDWPLHTLRQLERHGLLTVTVLERFPGGTAKRWVASLTEAGHTEAAKTAVGLRRQA